MTMPTDAERDEAICRLSEHMVWILKNGRHRETSGPEDRQKLWDEARLVHDEAAAIVRRFGEGEKKE